MSKLYKIFSVLAIAILLTGVVHGKQIQTSKVLSEEVTVQPEPEVPLSPEEYADKYALQYGIDARVFKKVMWCESGYSPNKVGDGGRAKNVLQYHRATFIGDAKEMGEDLDYNSYHDQIKAGAWSFSQGESYKRRWTAYRAIMNGGTYSFYSTLLQQHYTVNCKL